MKILNKPFTRDEYDEFVTECNNDGKLRIEIYEDGAYAMYDYEVYENGQVIDLRGTPEYEAEQAQIAKELRQQEIISALAELDQKRIRAICEPEEIREDGSSWLEYYNAQIAALREEYNSL